MVIAETRNGENHSKFKKRSTVFELDMATRAVIPLCKDLIQGYQHKTRKTPNGKISANCLTTFF